MSAAAVAERPLTPEEFSELEDSVAFELDDGRLEPRNVSRKTGRLGLQVANAIANFAEPRGLGTVYGADVGLQIFAGRPNRIPRADVVFVSRERLDERTAPDTPFLQVAPDLVVKIVSPSNQARSIDRKVAEYIEAGVRLVWVVYPDTRRALVYRIDGSVALIQGHAELDGEDVLPGFRLSLDTLFEGVAAEPVESD